MKKLSLMFALLIFATLGFAQPAKFNYQGVARNSAGNPIASQNISLRISILEGSATGTALYTETHTATTNAYGLYNVAIGSGTAVVGTAGAINWAAGNRYIKVEIDPAGGTAYTNLGASQLLSVPYARQASSLNIYPEGGAANATKMVITHSPE